MSNRLVFDGLRVSILGLLITSVSACSILPKDVIAPMFGLSSSMNATGLREPSPRYPFTSLDVENSLTPRRIIVRSDDPVGPPLFPRGGGERKVGEPYGVSGQMYYPKDVTSHVEETVSSWYGADFHGRKTANGEIYDMTQLTAAHPTLPMPSLVSVTNLENGRRLILRVNDRGPFVKGRMLDVSQRSAQLLGFYSAGVARVRLEFLGPAPLDGDDSQERRAATGLLKQHPDVRRSAMVTPGRSTTLQRLYP